MTDTAIPFVRICGQTTPDGPCSNSTNTQWFEGAGWRCRFHIPVGQVWPHSRRGVQDEPQGALPDPTPPPNGGKFKTIEEAQALMAWAIENLAMGSLAESRARGVINGCRNYIRSIATVQGKELMDKLERDAVRMGGLKAPQ